MRCVGLEGRLRTVRQQLEHGQPKARSELGKQRKRLPRAQLGRAQGAVRYLDARRVYLQADKPFVQPGGSVQRSHWCARGLGYVQALHQRQKGGRDGKREAGASACAHAGLLHGFARRRRGLVCWLPRTRGGLVLGRRAHRPLRSHAKALRGRAQPCRVLSARSRQPPAVSQAPAQGGNRGGDGKARWRAHRDQAHGLQPRLRRQACRSDAKHAVQRDDQGERESKGEGGAHEERLLRSELDQGQNLARLGHVPHLCRRQAHEGLRY